jgi:WbqC-like protein family
MKCVILQPSYIPWRGYFHLIRKCDLFIFRDDVQYDKSWRNRNRIKTPNGLTWLTVPVHSHGHTNAPLRPLREIEISYERDWVKRHLASLKESYRRAPFFDDIYATVKDALEARPAFLADLTIDLTTRLSSALGLQPHFRRASEVWSGGGKTDSIISILQRCGASSYITGPNTRGYIEVDKFREAGIDLEFMRYAYPEYEQLYPPYQEGVSILDLLFMKGTDAPKYIW